MEVRESLDCIQDLNLARSVNSEKTDLWRKGRGAGGVGQDEGQAFSGKCFEVEIPMMEHPRRETREALSTDGPWCQFSANRNPQYGLW